MAGAITASTHYYGNIVRGLFLLAGVIMLTTLPFFRDYLLWPAIFSIFSIFAILVFEHHAVTQFSVIQTSLFLIDQGLAR